MNGLLQPGLWVKTGEAAENRNAEIKRDGFCGENGRPMTTKGVCAG